MPQRDDLGLQPIEVQAFPFLISKADEVFARYKDRYPHQVNYISRRHAHIFLKGGELYVEDLGSTNGTFVGGKRLDETALPLVEGDLVAFGGDHFVYRVTLQKPPEVEPTVTQLFLNPAADEAADTDKTTFVGAAHSFLDIFCVDPGLQREDEVNEAAQAASAHAKRDALAGGQTARTATNRTNGANGTHSANGTHGKQGSNSQGRAGRSVGVCSRANSARPLRVAITRWRVVPRGGVAPPSSFCWPLR